jgi:large subunit ribosomal protein L3
MGGKQVTVRNAEIVDIDHEKRLILVKGQVPGPKSGLVTVKRIVADNASK